MAAQLKLVLSEQQKNQFQKYYELLVEKNKVMNLTAITDYAEVLTKHFLDSLSIVQVMDIKNVDKLIDVGTGGGFPGIPLKIVFPHLKVTLLDSLNKRIQWLRELSVELGLQEVTCIHGRAEDFGKDGRYREKYDLCVSRAVANLSTLCEYCIPFIKKGGYFVSYKSAAEEEMEEARGAIRLLGGEIEDVCRFVLASTDIERTLIKVKKERKTPEKYPRKAGIPSREPLR